MVFAVLKCNVPTVSCCYIQMVSDGLESDHVVYLLLQRNRSRRCSAWMQWVRCII